MSAPSESKREVLSKKQLDLLMMGRRSLYPRQFSGERIDDDVILQLLEYAHTAPNHKKTEPWRFTVYSEKSLAELIDYSRNYYLRHTPDDKISQKKLESFNLRKERTSHIIGIVMKRDELKRIPEIEEVAAVSCAVQNIYLSLNTFGLGGYWSTGSITFSEEIREFLQLQTDEMFLGFFYLGRVKIDIPVTKKDSVESKITWKR